MRNREISFVNDVLEADCTTGTLVEWISILQCEVLHVETCTCVIQCCSYADTFYLWLVDDDGVVHALADDRDIVTAD